MGWRVGYKLYRIAKTVHFVTGYVRSDSNSYLKRKGNSKHFQQANTANDIYLYSFGQLCDFPIYFALGKALEYRTPFILALEKADGETNFIED